MEEKIELIELERHDCCMLDLKTSSKEFYKEKKTEGFTGLYFRDEDTFFAIFPSKEGKWREFTIS